MQQTIVQTVAKTLFAEMASDPDVVVLGQDVGKRGGVFLATENLFDTYGPDRVIDTPLSEAAIIGAALGMATHGYRPVAEIQFSDYVYPGFDQLVSQVAKLRYRSGGQFAAPMVVRMPAGGGVGGGKRGIVDGEMGAASGGGAGGGEACARNQLSGRSVGKRAEEARNSRSGAVV